MRSVVALRGLLEVSSNSRQFVRWIPAWDVAGCVYGAIVCSARSVADHSGSYMVECADRRYTVRRKQRRKDW